MASKEKQLARYRSKRNFRKTREPSGRSHPAPTGRKGARRGKPAFVVQQHAARQLHFDFRLELDGIMKSWAVPRGPSLDPSARRLAVEVEDHPIEYNSFEGAIPEGEYGGGTVMIWDRGTYTVEEDDGADPDMQAAVRSGLLAGQLKFTLHGERLTGSFVLVRMRAVRGKPQWLLIKHRDAAARRGSDVTREFDRSVVSGRTMQEIEAEPERVWHAGSSRPANLSVEPMLATLARDIPRGTGWTYEPKYDGVRVLAYVTPDQVRLVTRNGRNKAQQFPEIVRDLHKLPGRSGRALVLDGEIVALVAGEPARFQQLQPRTNLTRARTIARLSERAPAALMVFDLLVDGQDVLANDAWTVRRARLEQRLGRKRLRSVRLSRTDSDPVRMLRAAQAHGWEGLLAKRVTAPYQAGHRSRDWLKLKIEQQQEFVVGGYTEPRGTREYFGSLLLGYYDASGHLRYAGHTGSGFTRTSLRELHALFEPIERATSPFADAPRRKERPHWLEPRIVVEVKFNEWTREGRLRQPIFLGVRTDKDPEQVVRERAR